MTTASESVATPAVRVSRLGALWQSAIGKKWLMAITGIVLFLFTVVHMAGNLQALKGAEALNHYAELLRVSMPFLWFSRIVLLAAALVHAIAGIQLWLQKQQARPVAYQDYRPQVSSVASRTMIVTGLVILAYVLVHLLDLTIGAAVAPASFEHGQVYQNLVASLSRAGMAILYLVAMVALGFHLWHGLWSVFQSLGLSNRTVATPIQKFAIGAAVLLTLGFAAIPVAVLVGYVR